MTKISGLATAESTRSFASRFDSTIFKEFGATRLTASVIGFGTYRIDVRVPEHRAALASALRRGVNLIDTSTNYADGNSERLVGEVVGGLIAEDYLTREELIIVTKAGYMQGENFTRMHSRMEKGDADLSPGSE